MILPNDFKKMATVHKTVLIGYSAQQMFALVERVEDYPGFLPWCESSRVHERTENTLFASIQINYRGIKLSFTTKNTQSAPVLINMQLVEGPFRALEGRWSFKTVARECLQD